MKLKITTLCLLLVSAGLFAQVNMSASTNKNEIILETATGQIKGTLLLPVTKTSKMPVVLIIAGSGPTDRNGNNTMMTNNSLKLLAEGLLEKGIASVRYDKRGVAQSASAVVQESDLRFETYIKDVQDWINLLKSDKRFTGITILGHSEGSLIGMIAAQNKEVAKFISLAGIGSAAGEVIREQLKSQPPVVLDQSLPIIERLEKGETVSNVPQMLYSLFRPSVQPYMISWFKYNPKKEIAKLNKPILIVQGTTDIQVSISEAQKIATAAKNAQIEIIDGMNHVLKDSPIDRQQNIQTYTNPTLPLSTTLIKIISEFILD